MAAGAHTFQITITKTYNTANLFEDLKSLYKMAGVKGQAVTFIFTCAPLQPCSSAVPSHLPRITLCLHAHSNKLVNSCGSE